MMVIAIIVSTMIIVASVVFVTQYHAYRKNRSERDKVCISKGSAGGAKEAPGIA